MPPNKVTSAAVVDSLADLRASDLLAKGTPKLTDGLGYRNLPRIDSNYWTEPTPDTLDHNNDSKAAEQQQQQQQQERQQTIFHICQDEEVRHLFAVGHLERNLLKDASRRRREEEQQQQQQQQQVSATSSEDGYWEMTTPIMELDKEKEEELVVTAPQLDVRASDSYWEGTGGAKYHVVDEKHHCQDTTTIIDEVMKEERIRQLLSVEHLEQNLLKDAAKLCAKTDISNVVHKDGQPTTMVDSESYWAEEQQ